MKPVVDGLKKKYSGTYDIRVLNTSTGGADVERLASQYGVQYVPTFIFVDSAGNQSGFVVGEVPVSTLERELSKLD